MGADCARCADSHLAAPQIVAEFVRIPICLFRLLKSRDFSYVGSQLEVVPQPKPDLFLSLVEELELARLAVVVVRSDAHGLPEPAAPQPAGLHPL